MRLLAAATLNGQVKRDPTSKRHSADVASIEQILSRNWMSGADDQIRLLDMDRGERVRRRRTRFAKHTGKKKGLWSPEMLWAPVAFFYIPARGGLICRKTIALDLGVRVSRVTNCTCTTTPAVSSQHPSQN